MRSPEWRVGRLYDQVTTTAHDPCVRLHNSARLTCDGRARRVLGVPAAGHKWIKLKADVHLAFGISSLLDKPTASYLRTRQGTHHR